MTEVRKRGMVAEVRTPDWRDEVAIEEPMEIRRAGRTLSITMRTPGHDEELAAASSMDGALRGALRRARS